MQEWQFMTCVHTVSAFAMSWLGQALFYGTLLAAVTWAVLRPLRKHVSPAFEAAVWTIVLLKFLLPIGPALPFSMASGVGQLFNAIPTQYASTSNTGSVMPGVAGSAIAPGVSALETGTQVAHWRTILIAAYLGGVLVLLAVRVRGYRAMRACCRNLPDADQRTFNLVRRVCRQLGVRRLPLVKLSDELPAPFVMGLLNPILVLSHRQLVRPDELETVLVHEVTHLRRGDLIVRCFQWIAGTLLFFWPVVAWVNRRIDTAREYACDQWALRHGKLSAGEYARCLLEAVQPPRASCLAYHPACMAGRHSNIERRIDVILESKTGPRRARIWRLAAATLVFTWGAFVLSGAAQAENPKKQWAPTMQDVKQRNAEMLAFVGENDFVDADGDGEVTVPEKHVYLSALAIANADVVLAQFPMLDKNKDGELGVREAYALARGALIDGSDLKKIQFKAQKAYKAGDTQEADALKAQAAGVEAEYWHLVMDDQQWMLDNAEQAPDAKLFSVVNKKIQMIWKKEKSEHAKKIKSKTGEHDQKTDYIEQLKKKIAKLEADGHQEKADQLKKKLKKVEQE